MSKDLLHFRMEARLLGRIYVTGDCHADFRKFSIGSFPEQADLTQEDYVIICGDFGGIWNDCDDERARLDWLSRKNFTIIFVDGNHENFDRLYGGEFGVVDFHGGKAHKIRENIYHLIRGYVFDICGKKIFAFGGASSHDIQDGILEPDDYKDRKALEDESVRLSVQGKLFRINRLTWWKEELPSDEEMERGLELLKEHDYAVDFIVSHCCPQYIASVFSSGAYQQDTLTMYFNKIAELTDFSKWFFGHYHRDEAVLDQFVMLYHQILRIV